MSLSKSKRSFLLNDKVWTKSHCAFLNSDRHALHLIARRMGFLTDCRPTSPMAATMEKQKLKKGRGQIFARGGFVGKRDDRDWRWHNNPY